MRCFERAPAIVSRTNPYVLALRDAVESSVEGDALSVGRDGASDAISFLEAGIPAVEFGPIGGGHHGPEEWVSLSSLTRYRRRSATSCARLPGSGSARRPRPSACAPSATAESSPAPAGSGGLAANLRPPSVLPPRATPSPRAFSPT